MKNFLKKIFGFSLGPFASALLGIILVPIITHFISPEEYGKANMFSVAQGLISIIIYMGMDQAYAREFTAVKDNKEEMLINAMLLPMGVSAVIAVVLVLLRNWVSNLLFGNENETLAVCLMAAMFPFMVVQKFSQVKLRFEGKGFQYSFFAVLLKVWTIIISVLLLVGYQRSFRSVVYGVAGAEIINGIVLGFVAFRNFHISGKVIQPDWIKSLLKYALPLIPATALSWILTSMDKLMLRSLCNYEELGLYGAASKIVSALGIIQTCFTTIWIPIAFRWYEEGKSRRYFELVMKVVVLIMSCACFGILMFKDIVGWVLGDDFVRAIGVFPFLLMNPVLYTMSETTSLGISFQRKTGYNIVVSIASGVVNLVMNYLLIPVWGGVGAAMATGLSYVVFFAVRVWLSRRVWYRFPVGLFVVIICVIIVNCAAHTFMRSAVPYVLSAVSLVLTVATMLPQILVSAKSLKQGE